jgi:hypothetical protein
MATELMIGAGRDNARVLPRSGRGWDGVSDALDKWCHREAVALMPSDPDVRMSDTATLSCGLRVAHLRREPVDNSVETRVCLDCGRSIPVGLHIRNAGLCFQCACTHEYLLDHAFHWMLERTDPQPSVPQRRA